MESELQAMHFKILYFNISKNENRITAAEMKFLRRSSGKTRRDRCRNATVREQLKQESLIDGIER
jgi:hypothetical protein